MTQTQKFNVLKRFFIMILAPFAIFMACLIAGYPLAEAYYRKNIVIDAGLKYALVVQAGKITSDTMGYDYTVPDIKETDILAPYGTHMKGVHISTSLNKITRAQVEITFIFDSTHTMLCQMVADELNTTCSNNVVIHAFDLPHSRF